MLTLLSHMTHESLNRTLRDLEIPGTVDEKNYSISPRLYSRFFRVLYNSTVLTQYNSQLALEWLAQSDYRNALVKNLDAGKIVAHKFGERSTTNADGSRTYQHHDCGIVYAESPYIICVMTEGKDLPTLANAIASLALTVDTFMSSR